MEFLYEYGLFFAKVATFVIAIGMIIGLIVSAGQKGKPNKKGAIAVTKLNDDYMEVTKSLKAVVLDEATLKEEAKAEKKKQKLEKKQQKLDAKSAVNPDKKRLFLLDFNGDIKASAVENLREEITALLTLASADDEVVVRLESSGGMVHSYGLASSQLSRITERNIPLTVCVDKVAASGGYMMACVAGHICAAPFAILGSIGVVAQLPNFHRLLKKNDVDFELLTAGEYKRTLTLFGENTDKGRQKFVDDLEKTHGLFKQFVKEKRPSLDIDAVATGEIWFGSQAKEQGLVDQLITSDDYIVQQVDQADIYHIRYELKKSLPERLGVGTQNAIESAIHKVLTQLNLSRFIQ